MTLISALDYFQLHDERKVDFEGLGLRARLSSVPFESQAYAEMVLPCHLDQSTDQATRRSVTMEYLLYVFFEWGLQLKDKAILELHSGPVGMASLVAKYGGLSYRGLEINKYLVSYANQNTCTEGDFSWYAEDTLSYVRRHQSLHQWDVVFALYETLNTFSAQECHELIQNLGRVLKKGACVVGDVRTDVQLFGHYKFSLSRLNNHIQLEEQGDIPASQMVARRTTTFDTFGALYEEYNCLRLVQVEQLNSSFASAGFKLLSSGMPLLNVDSDVLECQKNYFFIYEKIA